TRSGKVSASLAIEIRADEEQPRHAAQHQLERRPPAKQRRIVGTVDPSRRKLRRQQDLQTLVDAEDVRQPLDRIRRQRRRRRLLPAKEGRARGESEQRHLLRAVEAPFVGDAEEGGESGPRDLRGGGGGPACDGRGVRCAEGHGGSRYQMRSTWPI